jgi:hypothetical protein
MDRASCIGGGSVGLSRVCSCVRACVQVTLEMTLGMFATTPQWLALPYCEELLPPSAADGGAEGNLLMIEDITGTSVAAQEQQGDKASSSLALSTWGVGGGGGGGGGGSGRASVERQLIGGFGLGEDAKEKLRQRLLCGCC